MPSFIKDATTTYITRVLFFLTSTISAIIIARVLGPTNKGIFTLALLLPNLIFSIGHLGLGSAYTYYLGRKKYNFSTVLSNTFILSIVLGFSCIVITLILTFALRNSILREIKLIYVFIATMIIPFSLFLKYSQYILLGKQLINKRNILLLIEGFSHLFLIIILVIFIKGKVYGALISNVGTILISSLLGLFFLLKISNSKLFPLRFNRNLFKDSILYGFKSCLALIILTLNYSADIFLIKYFLSNQEVGIYSIATSAAGALWFLPASIGIVLFSYTPSFDKKTRDYLTPKVSRTSFLLSFLIAIILFFVAAQLIPLVFGPAYQNSIRPFQILLIGVLSIGLFKVLNGDLAGRGRPEIAFYVFSGALLLNIILNIWWIPKFGTIGAAWASTASYSFGAIIFTYVFHKITSIPIKDLIFVKKEDLKNYKKLIFYFLKNKVFKTKIKQ